MLKLSQVARKAFLPLVAATALTGATATLSLVRDTKEASENEKIETVGEFKNTFDKNAVGADTYTYATLFALGLLGSTAAGIAGNSSKKEEIKLKKLEEKSNELNLYVDVSDNKIHLTSRTEYLIETDKDPNIKNYTLPQIQEMVFLTVDKEYKPIFLTPEMLEEPDVKNIMKNLSINYSITSRSLGERLKEEFNMHYLQGNLVAIKIKEMVEKYPIEVREAIVDTCFEILRDNYENNDKRYSAFSGLNQLRDVFAEHSEQTFELLTAKGVDARTIRRILPRKLESSNSGLSVDEYALKYLLSKYNTIVKGTVVENLTTEELVKKYPDAKVVELEKGSTPLSLYQRLESQYIQTKNNEFREGHYSYKK